MCQLLQIQKLSLTKVGMSHFAWPLITDLPRYDWQLLPVLKVNRQGLLVVSQGLSGTYISEQGNLTASAGC